MKYFLINNKRIVNDNKTLSRGFSDLDVFKTTLKEHIKQIGKESYITKDYITNGVSNLLRHDFKDVLEIAQIDVKLIQQHSLADILFEQMGEKI